MHHRNLLFPRMSINNLFYHPISRAMPYEHHFWDRVSIKKRWFYFLLYKRQFLEQSFLDHFDTGFTIFDNMSFFIMFITISYYQVPSSLSWDRKGRDPFFRIFKPFILLNTFKILLSKPVIVVNKVLEVNFSYVHSVSTRYWSD